MEYRRLGRTDIDVSVICLGTMTWGQQNSEADAHQQLDYALDHEVNFIDTAEMYAVPPTKETAGLTETYIGNWLEARGNRDKVVLATKVAGRSVMTYLREGDVEACRLNKAQIEEAVNGSLRRLKTDYIDLYQVHWPERAVNIFGGLYYQHKEQDDIAIAETLDALSDLVKAGKVRHIGLSNETPWGISEYLRASREQDLERVVSIQNCYSLLNRMFEVGCAEFAIREDVGLLAYSPLAMGLLSGKYQNGARPEGARMTMYDRFNRYLTDKGEEAVGAYVAVAQKHGLDPAQMALAWVNSRPFVTANIIGATTMEQLASNIASADLTLSDEVIKDLVAVGDQYTIPCP